MDEKQKTRRRSRPRRDRGPGWRGHGGLGALGAAAWPACPPPTSGPTATVHASTRLQRLAMVLALVALTLVLRDLFFPTSSVPLPHLPASLDPLLPAMALITRAVPGHGGPPAGRRALTPRALPSRRDDR